MIQLLAIGICLPVSNIGPSTFLQWMQLQPPPLSLWPALPCIPHGPGVFFSSLQRLLLPHMSQ